MADMNFNSNISISTLASTPLNVDFLKRYFQHEWQSMMDDNTSALRLLLPYLHNPGKNQYLDIPWYGPTKGQAAVDQSYRTPIALVNRELFARRGYRFKFNFGMDIDANNDVSQVQSETKQTVDTIYNLYEYTTACTILEAIFGMARITTGKNPSDFTDVTAAVDGVHFKDQAPGADPLAPVTTMSMDDWEWGPAQIVGKNGRTLPPGSNIGEDLLIASPKAINELHSTVLRMGASNIFIDSAFRDLTKTGNIQDAMYVNIGGIRWRIVSFLDRGPEDMYSAHDYKAKANAAAPGYKFVPVIFARGDSVLSWDEIGTQAFGIPNRELLPDQLVASLTWNQMAIRYNSPRIAAFYKNEVGTVTTAAMSMPGLQVQTMSPFYVGSVKDSIARITPNIPHVQASKRGTAVEEGQRA